MEINVENRILMAYTAGLIGGNDRSIPIKQLKHRENCFQKIKQHQRRGCDLNKSRLIDSEAQKQGDEAQAVKTCSVND